MELSAFKEIKTTCIASEKNALEGLCTSLSTWELRKFKLTDCLAKVFHFSTESSVLSHQDANVERGRMFYRFMIRARVMRRCRHNDKILCCFMSDVIVLWFSTKHSTELCYVTNAEINEMLQPQRWHESSFPGVDRKHLCFEKKKCFLTDLWRLRNCASWSDVE